MNLLKIIVKRNQITLNRQNKKRKQGQKSLIKISPRPMIGPEEKLNKPIKLNIKSHLFFYFSC